MSNLHIGGRCSIQGHLAAHCPHVALPTWPFADIPARVFCLAIILGTEGFCKTSVIFLCAVCKETTAGRAVRNHSRFSVSRQGA